MPTCRQEDESQIHSSAAAASAALSNVHLPWFHIRIPSTPETTAASAAAYAGFLELQCGQWSE